MFGRLLGGKFVLYSHRQEADKNLMHLYLGVFQGCHAFATLSLRAGIDSKVVSESRGHSNISITVDLYQHAMTKMREAHAIAVDNLLKQEPQTVSP